MWCISLSDTACCSDTCQDVLLFILTRLQVTCLQVAMFSALSREAMGVVLHKDSKWYQQWKDFKDNNVVFNSKCSKDKGVAHYFPCSDSCCVGSNAICASSLNIMQIIAIFFLL